MTSESKYFSKYGKSFQEKIFQSLLNDHRWAAQMIEVMTSSYFDVRYLEYLTEKYFTFYNHYKTFPTMQLIVTMIKDELREGTDILLRDQIIEYLMRIKSNPDAGDLSYVKDKSLDFCRKQALKEALEESVKAIASEQYESVIDIMKDAISKGSPSSIGHDFFNDYEARFLREARIACPTGIPHLDKKSILNGGLGKGEIGVITAPTGVGKTTMLTRFANTAFNMGYNVLQIFFEDNPKIIQRKHFTCWTGIVNDELSNHKETVLDKADEMKKTGGKLILKKLPSDEMTILQIKNQVRKIISEGTKIDIILIDYIDCILPDRSFNDEWKGEGSVMRKFEGMCHELNIAGWTATQGNRSSISSDVVTTDQMGGSIKKAQVGHVIISVAKTLQQKEMGLATIAIVKSRLGRDGVIFENCKFDNGTLEIDTETTQTFLGFEKEKVDRNRERVAQALQRRQQVINKNN